MNHFSVYECPKEKPHQAVMLIVASFESLFVRLHRRFQHYASRNLSVGHTGVNRLGLPTMLVDAAKRFAADLSVQNQILKEVPAKKVGPSTKRRAVKVNEMA